MRISGLSPNTLQYTIHRVIEVDFYSILRGLLNIYSLAYMFLLGRIFLHDRQMKMVGLAEREGFLFSLFKRVNHDSFLISDIYTRPIIE